MSMPTNQQTYAKIKKLVEAVDVQDFQALQQKFGTSNTVAGEMYESINDYFDIGTKLTIAPEEKAFDSHGQRRPFIDTYETNDKALGLECVLFANGVPSEVILHVEISQNNGQLVVYYKYVGS